VVGVVLVYLAGDGSGRLWLGDAIAAISRAFLDHCDISLVINYGLASGVPNFFQSSSSSSGGGSAMSSSLHRSGDHHYCWRPITYIAVDTDDNDPHASFPGR